MLFKTIPCFFDMYDTNDNTNFIKGESVNSICSYFNLSNCFWNHPYLPSLAYVSTFNPVLLSSSTTHFHQLYRLQGNFIIFLPFSSYRFRQTLLFRLQLLFKLRSTFVSSSSSFFFFSHPFTILTFHHLSSSIFSFSFSLSLLIHRTSHPFSTSKLCKEEGDGYLLASHSVSFFF